MAHARCTFTLVLDLKAGHRCAAHAHECAEIVVNQDCSGWLWHNRMRYRYPSRSAFVYQPGTQHWIENCEAGRQVCVGVIGAGVHSLKPGVIQPDKEVQDLAEAISAAANATSPFRESKLDFLAGLLVLRLKELTHRDSPETATTTTAARARALLDENLTEKMEISDLARRVYVSPGYLRLLFRKEFGESPLHYVIRRRIEQSRVLLLSTNDPVQAVAKSCGFSSPFYFSRMFRKIIGVAPAVYRAKARSATHAK
ncbi:MAG: AraC family transcriptional regulator [Opitutaceae bacterium]|jgi:AraC-like DNA-binding protein